MNLGALIGELIYGKDPRHDRVGPKAVRVTEHVKSMTVTDDEELPPAPEALLARPVKTVKSTRTGGPRFRGGGIPKLIWDNLEGKDPMSAREIGELIGLKLEGHTERLFPVQTALRRMSENKYLVRSGERHHYKYARPQV